MNKLWPVIVLSLGLNVALAWKLGNGRSPAPKVPDASGIANTDRTGGPNESPALWAILMPGDPPALVARLRAAGFPPEVVRAIVQAQVNQEFQARRKALDPGAETRPFWKRNQPDAKLMAAQRQLVREQRARMKELLGPDAESSDPLAEFYRTRQFGELPPEKMSQVQAIQQEFQDKQVELFAANGGFIAAGTAIADKIREFERDQRNALARVLSAAELEQYDFRANPAGMNVRMRTVGMDLTEQEFRTLFQLQDSLEQQFPMRGAAPPSPDVMRQRSEAEQRMNEQIKGLLGPTRYAEYERGGQPDYRNTSMLVSRLELPPQTTQQIWTVREDLMQRATAIRTNRTLAPEQRTQQLSALQQEAAQTITPLVGGPRGYEAYQQFGGSWLRMINPQPTPRPGAPGGDAR